jgi:Zn ribbon nucleic-acid-binding protein
MYERRGSPANLERMLELTDQAERLQELYNRQWAEHEAYLAQSNKRIVLLDTGRERYIDSDFCPHLNTVTQMPNNGDEPFDECLDCGFVYRDDQTWGPAELPEDDRDYPDMFGELL